MFTLIIGAAASGKSSYAEAEATRLARGEALPLFYLATMQPFGREAANRIQKHREQRRDKGFETLECQTARSTHTVPECGVVLLECLSNLLANELFSAKSPDPVSAILTGIEHLLESSRHLVVVTNDVFADGANYSTETLHYMGLLGQLNAILAQRADCVAEVVTGIPILHKGALQ